MGMGTLLWAEPLLGGMLFIAWQFVAFILMVISLVTGEDHDPENDAALYYIYACSPFLVLTKILRWISRQADKYLSD